jgi:glycosyltransferase involved in cell wall biosynthesis
MDSKLPVYVLITPARNEAAFIDGTIQSVIAQRVLPAKWVIVSDGSTDETDSTVAKYAAGRPWMELIRMPEREQRNFAGKAYAFKAGCDRLADVEYDIIGNLDADVTFSEDYFDFLLRKFVENPRLGVAGTPFREGDFQYDFRYTNPEHVSGQIQMFRKECYEAIGGYRPIKTGGIDLTAVMTARMNGWQTRSFLEKHYEHHRKMGSAKHGWFASEFNGGRVDYILGCHPLWQLLRSIRRLTSQRPIILSGVLCMAGYLWAAARRLEKVIPKDLVRFRRAEEMRRLSEIFRSFLPSRQGAAEMTGPAVKHPRS